MPLTSIEWTNRTWNPTTGCDRVSPGCDHCYALTLAARLKAMGSKAYQNDGDPRTSGPGFGLTLHEDRLSHPFTWRKPSLVFVNSMSDLFHAKVPFGFVSRVWDVMARTPHHTYQILTKRPDRMARFAGRLRPLRNVWLGTSVEDQERAVRANYLRWPAMAAYPVRFLSVEPLLGPVDLEDVLWDPPMPREINGVRPRSCTVQWVIVGGESGPGARPCQENWIRDLRDQCLAAGAAFFLKQLGGHPDKRGHDKAILDGRLWREMPGVAV